jgi:anti-sigma-K factor RskA
MADAVNCDEAQDLLALNAVGALEPAERAQMEHHTATCPTCAPLAAQYVDVASLMSAALEPVPPPARLRRNLMAQVYAEASAAAPNPWWRRLVAAIPASRGITVLGVAAVAAAVILGFWGVAGGRSASTPITYVVSGSTSQPLVTGSVTLDSARTEAVLTVHGLAPLPASQVYEVWLIPAHGTPTGVAFLTSDPAGNAWTAVVNGSLDRFETIAATNEPVGGSPGPTGSQVLSGHLGSS